MEQKAWIIDEKTAKQYLTVEDAIDCVEKTWKWYGEGRVIMPNKITTDMSELGVAGWFNSMPAYIGPMDVAGIKVVGGYDGNKALGLPYIKANVLITDSKTGILRALISGDHINDLRTGAQPAVMARLLAAKTDVVTIIGTGLQGYMSLLCMSKVLDMKEIRVCDISEAAMDRFIARFPDAPFRFVKCKSNEEGCRGSDVIITVTNANADLVEEPWVKPGALVMTMGSFRETSFDVVRKADRIAVDQVGQSLHRGNVKELAEMGEITADSFDIIVPDVLAGKMPGRTDPNHRIYAQIIGTGMLDVALAGVLLCPAMLFMLSITRTGAGDTSLLTQTYTLGTLLERVRAEIPRIHIFRVCEDERVCDLRDPLVFALLIVRARLFEHFFGIAEIFDELFRVFARLQLVQVHGIRIIPAHVFLIYRADVVAKRAVILPRVPDLIQSLRQLVRGGDLCRGVALIDIQKCLVVDEFIDSGGIG